jgi:hypothetical protein
MAESYKSIEERMKKKSEETGLPLGKKIILPSSITGTPRWEAEQFQVNILNFFYMLIN